MPSEEALEIFRGIDLRSHRGIDAAEDAMLTSPKFKLVDQPLEHLLIEGLYVRKILNPAGSYVTTETHKFDHPFFVMQGHLRVVTADGEVVELIAPCNGVTKAGTRRLLYAVEDTIFITVHQNPDNETDLGKLRDRLVEPARELQDGKTAHDIFKMKLDEQKSLEGGAKSLGS